jgi:flagellar protein FlaI
MENEKGQLQTMKNRGLSLLSRISKRSSVETAADTDAGGAVIDIPPDPPVPDYLAGGMVEAYWLVPPFAYAVIRNDPARGAQYHLVEPEITPHELVLLEEVYEYLRDVTMFEAPVRKEELSLEFEDARAVILRFDADIPEERIRTLYYYLRRNFLGYGRIDPLMHDDLLEDISCNGPAVPLFVYHRGYANMETNLSFSHEELNRFVLKLSQKADKQISLTTPLVDAALPDGSRAQITYYDVVSTRGSSFTIRKFRSEPMTPVNLIEYHTYSPEILAFIWLAVENRMSMIIAGGTACGKTSTMNAISFFIPHNAKIVSIEDTREIQLPHENWLPVQTRETVGSTTRGDIDMFELLRASLRQRPEYIVVGEVRGREAQTLFQAMNTGHTTFSTLHAGTIEEAVNRLTHDPINVPSAMFGALDLIVIQSLHYRAGKVIRRCDAVHEIEVDPEGDIVWQTLWQWSPHDDEYRQMPVESKTLAQIAYMHGWSPEEVARQLATRAATLRGMHESGTFDPAVFTRSGVDIWGVMDHGSSL